MKQFNLDEYLKNPNRKVVTRDGRKVRVICTDYYSKQSIIAKVEESEYSYSFSDDGRFTICGESSCDLFFAPERKEGWVNIFPNNIIGGIYESEEEAKKAAFWSSCPFTTIKIEWEE